MKKSTLTILFLFMTAVPFSIQAIPSNEKNSISDPNLPFILKKGKSGRGGEGIKGKMIFTLGVGLNAAPTFTAVRYASTADTIHHNFNVTYTSFAPIYNFIFDYGIVDRFTVGVGLGYQSFNINWGDNTHTFVDTWKRFAVSARGDYRIVATETIGLYTGLRIGYNIYSLSSTASPFYKNYTTTNTSHPQVFAFQAHFGFSYYFNGSIGVNSELGLALGGPYYASLGLTYKL
jgi:hypothetical protein